MVDVFKVKVYDIATDEWLVSNCMATIEGARLMHGQILANTRVVVRDSDLVTSEQWTEKDFDPLRRAPRAKASYGADRDRRAPPAKQIVNPA